MKIKGFIALTAVIALLVSSCSMNSLKSAKLKTENDTLSYAIASNIYSQLAADSISLNPAIVAKAFIDSKNGKVLMTEEEVNAFCRHMLQKGSRPRQNKRLKSIEPCLKIILQKTKNSLLTIR